MSGTVSTCIAELSAQLQKYETDGVVLEPPAVTKIRELLDALAGDAARLEKMLERRLTARAADAAKGRRAIEAVHDDRAENVILLRPRGKSGAPSTGDAA